MKTEVGSQFPLPGIFPTQESNLGLPRYRKTLYHLSHQGSPWYYKLHTFMCCDFLLICLLEEVTERTWLSADWWAEPRQPEAHHCLPCWSHFKCRSEIVIFCWDHLDGICNWTQLKPLHKILRFWWVDVEIMGLPIKISHVKAPLLTKTATCLGQMSI